MSNVFKRGLKWLIDLLVASLGTTTIGKYINTQVIRNAMGRTKTVNHHGLELIISTPNALNIYRADTFASKEPETLEWIDGMPDRAVVWDIGANVGLYSCYAAKKRGCRVFAFEPSVFNLELLARNIYLNGLTELITIVPLPLTDELTINKLNLTTTDWGGALSTFARDYGHDGQSLQKVFEFATVGLSMNDAVGLLGIPPPDYIKMDVDGIEHLILSGGQDLLRKVRGVLIEINDDFTEQSQGAAEYLTRAGLGMIDKRHSEVVEGSAFQSAFNQIWSRSAISE